MSQASPFSSICRPGSRTMDHLAYAPFRMVSWQVEDALTGAVLHRAVLTEQRADKLCAKIKKHNPAAFVKRVEG